MSSTPSPVDCRACLLLPHLFTHLLIYPLSFILSHLHSHPLSYLLTDFFPTFSLTNFVSYLLTLLLIRMACFSDVQRFLIYLNAQVDVILEQLSVFWANTEVVLDVLTKKGQHIEQFIGFSHKPRLIARFRDRMEEYKRFWEGISIMCNNYVLGVSQHGGGGGGGVGGERERGSDRGGGGSESSGGDGNFNRAHSQAPSDVTNTFNTTSQSGSKCKEKEKDKEKDREQGNRRVMYDFLDRDDRSNSGGSDTVSIDSQSNKSPYLSHHTEGVRSPGNGPFTADN